MDKYELNIKIEKMKKAADRKDYATAAKVADSLNWEKSTNAKILMLIAQIYEKQERYSDARSALTVVYNRVPVGKRIVYKLAELSIKCGEVEEAMDLYREFQEIAPNDPSKLILAYRISVANGEPIENKSPFWRPTTAGNLTKNGPTSWPRSISRPEDPTTALRFATRLSFGLASVPTWIRP